MGTKQDSLKQRRAALKKKKREAKRKSRQLQVADREDNFLLSPDDELLSRIGSGRIDSNRSLQLSSFNVVFERMPSKYEQKLPVEVKDYLTELHDVVLSNPQRAIEPLEQLKREYPDIPRIYNYLMIAYMKTGHTKKADAVIIENYQKHPDYLFARTNYAEYCLRHDNLDEIYKIFDSKFDLKLLYPHRNDFHISEVTGFYGIIGIFFLRIGERESAENLYKMLKRLDPDHSATKILGRELGKEFVLSKIKNLLT